MEYPLNPTLTMFSLVIYLFIYINIPPVLADDVRFRHCRNNTFSCGGFRNISYPFWGDNRANYCGLPDFQLKCEGNIPRIIIKSLKYRVLYLGLTSQILTVAREDYLDTICQSDYKNNTFDPTIFQYVAGLDSVTFLYGCNNTSSSQSHIFSQECLRDNKTFTVYYAPEKVYISDCKSVIMPMQPSKTASVTMSQLQVALNEGFELRWIVNNEQCDACTKSGGECGRDGQFSCFCKEGPQKTSCSRQSPESTIKQNPRFKTAIAISGGICGFVLITIVIIYGCKKLFRKGKWKFFEKREAFHDYNLHSIMKKYGSLAPTKYSYSELKKMTNSFSDKLGEGGYGIVYKASLRDGRLVAVKVIRDSKGSGEEFINEVASISKTSHVNIVTLLGFCYERKKRALIYEYMSNGSLDNFIYKRGSPNAFCTLEWTGLYQIVTGIAQGLRYLHQGCNTRILHLDIKPQNILLDENFCPKISDFGLAKICQRKESIVSLTGTRGTIGFIAPEIFRRTLGGVSHKADVYSFGMLIIEMVGGRKNHDSRGLHSDEMYFPDWIYKDLELGDHSRTTSSTITEEDEVVRKMILVSLWCIQTNPTNRPAMSKVVEMLEGPLQSLSIPPKPSLQSSTTSPLQFSNGTLNEIIQTNSISTY